MVCFFLLLIGDGPFSSPRRLGHFVPRLVRILAPFPLGSVLIFSSFIWTFDDCAGTFLTQADSLDRVQLVIGVVVSIVLLVRCFFLPFVAFFFPPIVSNRSEPKLSDGSVLLLLMQVPRQSSSFFFLLALLFPFTVSSFRYL